MKLKVGNGMEAVAKGLKNGGENGEGVDLFKKRRVRGVCISQDLHDGV